MTHNRHAQKMLTIPRPDSVQSVIWESKPEYRATSHRARCGTIRLVQIKGKPSTRRLPCNSSSTHTHHMLPNEGGAAGGGALP